METGATTKRRLFCECESAPHETRTYYIWYLSNEKQKVEDVVDLYLTLDEVVLDRKRHDTLAVPRDNVLMVTCAVCSAPPFG